MQTFHRPFRVRSAGAALAAAAVLLLAPYPALAGDTAQGGELEQGGGISLEEYLRGFPPAPVNVRAEDIDGRVLVFWEAPPNPGPAADLAYDPAIDSYRVYKLGPGLNRTLIGETTGTWFIDASPPGGSVHRYAVTAVQRTGQESGASNEAKLRVR